MSHCTTFILASPYCFCEVFAPSLTTENELFFSRLANLRFLARLFAKIPRQLKIIFQSRFKTHRFIDHTIDQCFPNIRPNVQKKRLKIFVSQVLLFFVFVVSASMQRAVSEPPGKLGFPFVGETIQFGSSVTDFARTRHEMYGPVWKTRIAQWKSLFVTGWSETNAIHSDREVVESMEISQGVLSMVEPIFGKGFYLYDGEESTWIRKLLSSGLDAQSIQEIFFPVFYSQLAAHWDSIPEGSFCAYDDSKDWIGPCLIASIVGVAAGSPEMTQMLDLSADMFRGVTSVPISFIGMGFSKASTSRDKMIELLRQRVNRERESQEGGDMGSKTLLAKLVTSARDISRNGVDSEFPLDRICTDLLWLSSSFLVKNLASACSTTLLLILQHRAIFDECAMEQEQFKGRAISFDELEKFEILHRCVEEAMRLWPPSLMVCRGLAKDIVLPNLMSVARDYKIWFHLYQINRDERSFESPDEFFPDRWKETQARKCPHSVTFGVSEDRGCLGRVLTMTIVKMYIADLIRRMTTVELVEGQSVDMKYLPVNLQFDSSFDLKGDFV